MLNRSVFLFFLFACCPFIVFPQKPPIDSAAIISWPSLSLVYAISNNGRWFSYTIENEPVGSHTLMVEATDHSWEKAFIGANSGFFSGNNKQYIFPGKDSLYFLQLGTGQMEYLTHIDSYRYFQSSKADYLAYMPTDTVKELVLRNLVTGKERRFDSVNTYSFDNGGSTLLIQSSEKRVNINTNSLQWVSLPEGRVQKIWSRQEVYGEKTAITGTNFDESATQLVFTVQETSCSRPVNTIWYYQAGMGSALLKVSDRSAGIEPGFAVSSEDVGFSGDGLFIFFKVQLIFVKPKMDSGLVKVDVWNYRDSILQSEQLNNIKAPQPAYSAVIGVASNNLVRLEHSDEEISGVGNKSDYVLIFTKKSIVDYWWPSYKSKYCWLVSLKDGSRKLFDADGSKTNIYFSPWGDRLLYYDTKAKHYYSYVLQTGGRVNISKGVRIPLDDHESDLIMPGIAPQPVGLFGWLSDESGVLVYDINGDLWQLALNGKTSSVNITHNFGRLKHIRFSMIDGSTGNILPKEQPLLLTTFDTATKYNGFYRIHLDQNRLPDMITACPCTIDPVNPFIRSSYNSVMAPLKAGGSDVWVVERQSALEAPNYYLTRDFKTYDPLTDMHPQRGYNWLTAELITWMQLDGTQSQGILYKPEDFDPHKKYPILFHYYEQMSDRIYEYPEPDFSYAAINIPWFVSHGYLVFTPDIHSTVGERGGKGALNAVVSAAMCLSKRLYVDKRRMGLQGHSFGGFETNYILSHSHLFAAASEGAGVSDDISMYTSLGGTPGHERGSITGYYENGQGRIGGSLWQKKEAYLDNSAILRAEQVTTPILIVHNRADDAVHWNQGVAWYISLRRLGKKVWMLQYDEGGHMVDPKDAVDLNTRLTQFFDYYLKRALPPRWMTRGIPASMKGIDNGLELDTSGQEP